jgi:L-ribulose-5-phosphate 4-epimerase
MAVLPKKDIQEASKAFRWASGRAFQRGLQVSTGGNISIRVGPGRFLTKPTGVGLFDCLDSDLVIVDAQGRPLEAHAKPTKDIQVHLAIFQKRPDVNGIVHYHAPYATAYAVKGQTLPLPTVHARRVLKEIPLIGEYPEGSPELADAVVQAFEDKEVVGLLMVDHGLLAIGPTLQQAQYRAELMEESARINWLSQHIS